MTRLTVNDWLGVEHENIIARKIASARFKLADLGQLGGIGLRALYISGPPGIGKTHSVNDQELAWRAAGLNPIRCRPQNFRDLLDIFAAAEGRNPIIMEEADILFRSKPMFEILKQATDPISSDYLTRIVKIDEEKVPQQINLNVPIIVTTNMNLSTDAGWHKSLIADRDALFNRSRPIIIPDEPLALWEWSVYLALRSHLTKTVNIRNPSGGRPLNQAVPLQVQSGAIQWFTNNINKLAVISPRTLKQVAQFFARTHRGDMPEGILREELDSLLGEEARQPVELPACADWPMLLKSMPKLGEPVQLAA